MGTLLKELAVERFRFSCPGCGHAWSADYDVQHAEDGHGVTWEYHSLNGIPVPAPTVRGSVSCPRCGATWVRWRLLAVREIPLVDPAGGEHDAARPRQQVDEDRQAARHRAPLLQAEQPPAPDPAASSSGSVLAPTASPSATAGGDVRP